ncbi:amino acid permease [Colletotrichum higginsianum]|uniref:Amino acid permease n=1 Tax=Colletotrichum higginsianum (strain IMI 349063) TaxID=759273 RepID=H1VYG8_COLHI|nr:Amino acid permease [Colletotrichum higginsianum IMI 349063]OBR16152.1 Amino acid permease [Colletotrichum higginsianum IMI 349063]GJC91596.1 amino acid permease [Colletotrichum higginsianum]CCF45280.1 amino acid permease [Colletotrichum higginsianum]
MDQEKMGPSGLDDISHQQSAKFGQVEDPNVEPGHELHRRLETRHVTMIALGGALGTGLLIGTGSALVKAGPAGILIDYSIVGCIVFLVMAALGEIISYMPLSHGFGGYATRFVDPALGFATGYVYFFKYLLATPNQLSAFALIMKFWVGDRVNPAVFISIALVLIVAINSISVKAFGEFEFWLSSLKVIIMVGVILLLFILAVGGGPTGDRPGFRYWSDPGAFAEYKVEGAQGRLLGVWSAMVAAVYAFSGTELVGVTVGEAKNPRLSMPKAVRLTFMRIVFFYVISVFLLGMVVPYNSPELVFAAKAKTSAAASPFVVAITIAKIKGLDHVINACLVIFVFSAANSDIYISSRTLYGIAVDGKAPRIFTRTTKSGVPYVALGLCGIFCSLAYMSVSTGAATVFGYLTNMVTVFGLLTWISILISHIFFCRARDVQSIDPAYIPYRAPFGIWGSYAALGFLIILTLTKGIEVFVGTFDYKNFIVQYIGIPVYLICIFGFKILKRTSRVHSATADLLTGVPLETVAEERAAFEAERREKEEASGNKGMLARVYRKGFAWLF